MKKKDLRTGMRVECDNDITYIVILGNFNFSSKNVTEGLLLKRDGYMELSNYDDNLIIIKGDNSHNIIKVYDNPNTPSLFLDVNCKGALLWQRKTILIFKYFIIRQGINWNDFLNNCRVENQRWENKKEYNKEGTSYYKKSKPKNWLYHCFNWEYSLVSDSPTLVDINDKWLNLVRGHRGEIMFE